MFTLAVAFNKKIADELKAELPVNITCKTLNGLGHQAWSSALGGKRLELNTDKLFKHTKAILGDDKPADDDDLFIDVLNLARKAKSVGLIPAGAPMNKQGIVPDADYAWRDLAFECGITLDAKRIDFAKQVLLASINSAYKGIIDFDDQIYMSALFGGVFAKYHTVIVDEAQDLSALNHLMLKKSVGTRLIAVGDPFQAIYAFRGADSESMNTLFGQHKFVRLGLTYSFRCPHTIAERQLDHVADFRAWSTNGIGHFEQWPRSEAGPEARGLWSIADLPKDGAILCRNNAPLMKLAFAIIKTRRPVKILGRDIGASLASLLAKITKKKDLPVADATLLLDAWATTEMLKVPESESKLATIADRRECLWVLLDASGAKSSKEAENFIRDLFADKQATGLVLSSIHRSKGLEWNWVLHLDPWRVPSKFALKAAKNGNSAALTQELNLKYVAETRTKNILVEASLDTCEELDNGA
jgi:hypothetical protein